MASRLEDNHPLGAALIAPGDVSRRFPWASTCLYGGLLLFCCALSDYPTATYISLLGLIGYFTLLLKRDAKTFLKYLALLFSIVGNIVGCVSCEFGQSYLPELNACSFFAGSIPLLVLASWAFLLTLVALDCLYGNRVDEAISCCARVRKSPWIMWANAIILVVLCAMLVHVAMRPSFLLGLDRFSYASQYLTGIWGTLSNLFNYAILIPLMAIRRGYRKTGVAACLVYVVYLFWIGTKFGGFFSLLAFILLVFYDRLIIARTKTLFNLSLIFILMLSGLIVMSIFANSLVSTRDGETFITQRVSQQGQLWWRIYSQYDGGEGADELLTDFVGQINDPGSISDNYRAEFGIYKIMYLAAPMNTVDAKLLSGSRYSEAGYAAAYYYGGSGGVVAFAVLCAGLIHGSLMALLLAIHQGLFIDAVLICRLYSITRTFWSMFLYGNFFEPMTLISIAYLLIVRAMRRSEGAFKRRGHRFCEVNQVGCPESCSGGLIERE